LVPSRVVGLGLAAPVVAKRDIAQLYYRAEMYFGEVSEAERRALWLWRVIETGGFGSRILGAARQQGLAYHVSGLNQAEPGKSMAGMSGYVTPEHARPLFELIAREVAVMRHKPVSDVELEAAKDLIVGTISRQIQTPSDLLGWYIERYDETDKVEDVEAVLELIRAVRPEEIQAVAIKAAAAGRMGLSFVGPVDAGTAGEYAAILALMGNNS
jgi:predicted Zn-dependent peptidase